jgi:hypothetical protein
MKAFEKDFIELPRDIKAYHKTASLSYFLQLKIAIQKG